MYLHDYRNIIKAHVAPFVSQRRQNAFFALLPHQLTKYSNAMAMVSMAGHVFVAIWHAATAKPRALPTLPLRQLWFSSKKFLTILENKNLEGNPPKECD